MQNVNLFSIFLIFPGLSSYSARIVEFYFILVYDENFVKTQT